MMRLTKDVVQKILDKNEGEVFKTYYESRNLSLEKIYTIHDGKMTVRSVGDTSWADSDFDETEECDIVQTRRILKKFEDKLDLDI